MDPGTLEWACHNLWVGNTDARENTEALCHATGQPDVAALTEAHRLKRGVPDYFRVTAESRWADWDMCQLLVHDRCRIVRRGTIRGGTMDWTHKRKHPPRLYPWAVIERDGIRWDVLVWHQVPGSVTPNVRQRAQHLQAAADWANRRAERFPRRARLILGDGNGQMDELARAVGGRAVTRGPDGGVFVDCRPVDVRQLKRMFGSDSHHPVAGGATIRGRERR